MGDYDYFDSEPRVTWSEFMNLEERSQRRIHSLEEENKQLRKQVSRLEGAKQKLRRLLAKLRRRNATLAKKLNQD